MVKALLISDTHGDLDMINRLVEQTKADLVIHAGDFGFYDDTSYRYLSPRELFLLIVHSHTGQKFQVDRQSSKEKLIEIVKEHQLLGHFADYEQGRKNFTVPVYAVYGNHEDVNVIKKIKQKNTIHNFHLLDEETIYKISDGHKEVMQVLGIGGNFLVSNKLLKPPLTGVGGKVFGTLHQFGVLYQKLQKTSLPSIFVSHVSPGKEPLLSRLLIHFMPKYCISGHMGAPYTCVWNQFTIREIDESLQWFDSELDKLEALPTDHITPEARVAYDLIKKKIVPDQQWYRNLWNINLPDAKDGFAILRLEGGRFRLECQQGN